MFQIEQIVTQTAEHFLQSIGIAVVKSGIRCDARTDLEQDEKENGWILVDERLPDPDEHILVSFFNFSLPMIGRYTVDDDDGGTFRVGDEDESFCEHDLYVNAWMPLPEPYKED